MGKSKGKKGSSLGRSIIKDRFGSVNPNAKNSSKEQIHVANISKGGGGGRNLQSVLDQNDVAELLEMAELADQEFTAEKDNAVLINTATGLPFGAVRTGPSELTDEQRRKYESIPIPRRPRWDAAMSADVLDAQEKDAFLEWRRHLARIEEEEGVLLTPFEKNLEVWRQLWRVIERSDVIVQIVDARNPLLFRSVDLVSYVTDLDPSKRNVLLVNKADLLSPPLRRKWAAYFAEHGIEAVFFSAAQEKLLAEQAAKAARDDFDVGEDDPDPDPDPGPREADGSGSGSGAAEDRASEQTRDEEEAEESSGAAGGEGSVDRDRVHGRDDLIERLLEMSEKRPLTVGMVGYPNVGKSSTINVLFGDKHVAVSATPGKTKHFQTLQVSEELTVCDCPGLVFPSAVRSRAELVCNGVLPIDQLREFRQPIAIVCKNVGRRTLEGKYGIVLPRPSPDKGEDPHRPPTAEEVLQAYGHIRGFMTVHGVPDESRAARYILKDYVTGKLVHCELPPGYEPDSASEDTSEEESRHDPAQVDDQDDDLDDDEEDVAERLEDNQRQPSVPTADRRPKPSKPPTAARYMDEEGAFFAQQDKVVAHVKGAHKRSRKKRGQPAGPAPFTRTAFPHRPSAY